MNYIIKGGVGCLFDVFMLGMIDLYDGRGFTQLWSVHSNYSDADMCIFSN